jgi:hypothetical protein
VVDSGIVNVSKPRNFVRVGGITVRVYSVPSYPSIPEVAINIIRKGRGAEEKSNPKRNGIEEQ